MKKKKVKEKLYKIQMEIIEQIEDPTEEMEQFLFNHQKDSMKYGYQVGMSRAAMILLDKIFEMYPDVGNDEDYKD